MGTTLRLRLFVIGTSPRASSARHNLERILESAGVDYELEVVDLLEHPDLAESEGILATPTLVREKPTPRRRLIGDLSDGSLLLSQLGVAADEISRS